MQPSNVGAVNAYESMSASDQIRSAIYYETMKQCFSTPGNISGIYGIATDNIDNGNWFKNNNGVWVETGVFMKDQPLGSTYSNSAQSQANWNGQTPCENQALVTGALELWGFTSATEFLCEMGWNRINWNNQKLTSSVLECENKYTDQTIGPGGPGTTVADGKTFSDYIGKVVYGGVGNKPPSPTPEQLYMFYRHSLDESCIPGIDSTKPTQNFDDFTGIKWVDLNATPPSYSPLLAERTYGYWAANGFTTDTPVALGPFAGNTNLTCLEIKNLMNANADAYVAYAATLPPAALTLARQTTTQKTSQGGASTCQVPGIGWIVCPVVRFLAWVADGAFTFLSENFLRTDPGIFGNSTDDSLYRAWSAMRNIANVAFVIAFLVIIFSQITSAGITNYGIKKLLPRLIIAAILVNLSYYICQIAVDISNILGWTLKDFLSGIYAGTPNFATSWGGDGTGLFSNIAGGILVTAGAGLLLYAALATFIPIILAAVVALIMILFILIARQALIVLLIAISPIAFVAFLLPNTMSWFTKWQKTFSAMLMLFPIIAFVYGMSILASNILKSVSFGSNSWTGELTAAAVIVLPLFVVPGLLKKALDGVGTIGAKISGLGDKWGKSAGDKYTNSPYAKYQKSKNDMDTALTRAGAYTGKNPFKKMSSRINGGLNRNTRLNKLNRGYGNAQSAAGIELAETESEREIKSSAAQLKYARLSQEQTLKLAKGESFTDSSGKIFDASKNENLRYAAMQSVVATNDVKGMNDLWDEASSWEGPEGNKRRTVFADALQASSGRPVYFGQGAIASMRQGENTDSTSTIVDAINTDAYSAEKIAGADREELSEVARVARDRGRMMENGQMVGTGDITQAAHQRLVNNAQKAVTDPILSAKVAKNLGRVDEIRHGQWTPPPQHP